MPNRGENARVLFEAMVQEQDPNRMGDLMRDYTAAVCADVEAERQRRASAPRMALRPDCEDPDLLDDVVVEHPTMYRAEMMSENELWMCCYFPEPHERISFWVSAVVPKGKRKPVLRFSYTEGPSEWVDIDKERHDA